LDKDASRVRAQKNVYPAGRRVGRPDTTGRMVFFNLDKLQVSDSVVVEDRSGNQYKYEVSEVFVVEPDADWVVDHMRGRDMVTLQTCTYSSG
jgi:sortase A